MNQSLKTEISAVGGVEKYQSPQMTVVPIRIGGSLLTGSAVNIDPMRSDIDYGDHHNVASQYTAESSSGWDNFFGSAD